MGMPPLAGWVSPLPGNLHAGGLHVSSYPPISCLEPSAQSSCLRGHMRFTLLAVESEFPTSCLWLFC